VPVCRESEAGAIVGDPQNTARGFARLHNSYYVARSGQVRRISTEQDASRFLGVNDSHAFLGPHGIT
jgi:hypothetical protein